MARRELFDARLQVLSSVDSQEKPEVSVAGNHDPEPDSNHPVHFLNAPSDLIQGVYEGGLKTWECSLDLVSYLNSDYQLPSYDFSVLEYTRVVSRIPRRFHLQQGISRYFSNPGDIEGTTAYLDSRCTPRSCRQRLCEGG